MTRFVIRNVTDNTYWSNEWGWTSLDEAERFESMHYHLPLDGKWEPDPNLTTRQRHLVEFALRFLRSNLDAEVEDMIGEVACWTIEKELEELLEQFTINARQEHGEG